MTRGRSAAAGSFRTGAALAGALCLPLGLAAQTPDTARTPADSGAIPLAPIQVSVLRTPLSLSRVPYSVTVETVNSRGPGLTLADALGAVPGLQVDNRYNFAQGDRISIRGLGARAQFGVRGVKVLVDGIPATLADGQTTLSHVDPRLVERAQVIRGPASAAWGNAAGGLLRLETGPAMASGFGASAVVGSHGLLHVTGSAARPDGPGPALDVSLSRLTYDGFRAHAGAEKFFAATRARWIGDRDEVTLVAHGVAYDARNPGSLSTDLMDVDRTQAYTFNVTQNTGERAEQAQVGVTWRRTFASSRTAGASPGLETVSVAGWGLARSLDNPIPPAIIDLAREAVGLRASIRGWLPVAGRTLTWTAGLDAEGQWDDRRNHENDAGTRGPLTLDQAETVTALAPFVEAETPVAGPVRMVAGLRYDRVRFQARDRLVTAADPDDSGSRVMGQLSPSLGLVAEGDGWNVYASAASSFETPTTTELVNRPGGGAGFNPSLAPQRTRSVEVGGRLRMGAGLSLHAAAFRMGIRDALIPFEVATDPGRTYYRNAGSAIHSGVELDAWAAPARWLRLRVGYSRVDARFRDFVSEDGDRSGNPVPGVAPNRLRGTVAWTGWGRLEATARWVDAMSVDDANSASSPAYTLVDLRGALPSLSVAGSALEIYGGIDNLLDAEYVASVVVNAFGGRYYEPGPGRAFFLGLRLGP